jgi:uncharacterized protein (TIGR02466 family)
MQHHLFVTQVYQAKLGRMKPAALASLLALLKEEILQIQKADRAGKIWSAQNYRKGYTSYGSWDRLHELSSSFADLVKQIDPHVKKFAQALDYDLKKAPLKIDSLWVNVMPAGAQHSAHIHPHSVISGTFYVDVPESASYLKFEDPRLGFFMAAGPQRSRPRLRNQRFVSIRPKAGELVLFESWLRHEVPPNNSRTPRLSISFNYS